MSLSSNLSVLETAIPTDEAAYQSLQVLIGANNQLRDVFGDISSRASLDNLSPLLDTASMIELIRYMTILYYYLVDTCSHTHTHTHTYIHVYTPHTPRSLTHSLTHSHTHIHITDIGQ